MSGAGEYQPFVSAAERKRRLEQQVLGGKRSRDGAAGAAAALPAGAVGPDAPAGKSLSALAAELRTDPEFEEQRRRADEAKFLETVMSQQKALLSAAERAQGAAAFTEPLRSGWRPVRRVRAQAAAAHDATRLKYHIACEGEELPPPCLSFMDMRRPRPILAALDARGIRRPTPIQVQGLPVALSGRDMIGIAFTGSGKTLTFSLPMVLMALGEELKAPVVGGEGPLGVILGPSRELMSQTFELVQSLCDALAAAFQPLRAALCIGGVDKRDQVAMFRERGCHMVVATPGRLADFLQRGDLNLDVCRYFCLDEGDRMVADEGFEEELQKILGFCRVQRQTLLFSATMPKKVVDFAQASLIRPVTVNVGRAGAANLDIIQEVEVVRDEHKIVYLLQCLQKSPPPVVIFCDNKKECDDVHEYLLLKGVDAAAIHGGKDQQDRNQAVQHFKAGHKDVLVATDVAAKGLDFPAIQHVINFNMPQEIENYVHRIGRTGRSGKTGIATTFINDGTDSSILLDLKHLLVEAKQRVPPALLKLEDPMEEVKRKMALAAEQATKAGYTGAIEDEKGCSYCGGLGHRIVNCPKLQSSLKSQQANRRDVVGGAAFGGNY